MKRWIALVAALGIVATIGCGAKKTAPVEMAAPEKTMEAPKAMDKPTSATTNLVVGGLMCNTCANTVASAIKGTAGVSEATVDLAGKSAAVTYDPTKTDPAKIAAAVNGTKHLHDAAKTYTASVK